MRRGGRTTSTPPDVIVTWSVTDFRRFDTIAGAIEPSAPWTASAASAF